MDVDKIKQIADKCQKIEEFIRQVDSNGNTNISAINNGCAPLPADLVRELWPEFRKQLVAKYNELAAIIVADKFFDTKEFRRANNN